MPLEHVEPAGHTQNAVKELQGLNISLVTGGAADAKYDLAAIRSLDTIAAVHNNNAGALTDITGTVTIAALNASGTLTLATAVEGSSAVVNGVTYAFTATPGAAHTSVDLGADDTEAAANLAAAINAVEGGAGSANEFYAESAVAVVTVTARAEGPAGNAITIVGSTEVTASAATLENGTDTGGVLSSGVTNQMVVYWFNKG